MGFEMNRISYEIKMFIPNKAEVKTSCTGTEKAAGTTCTLTSTTALWVWETVMEGAHWPLQEFSARGGWCSCMPHHDGREFYDPKGRPASFWVTSKVGAHWYCRVYPQPTCKLEENVLSLSWGHFFGEVFYYLPTFPTTVQCLGLCSLPFYIQCRFLFPAR